MREGGREGGSERVEKGWMGSKWEGRAKDERGIEIQYRWEYTCTLLITHQQVYI